MPWNTPRDQVRMLRRAMTPPEVVLWEHLRGKKIGFKFRHQHRLGPYVLDFFCHEAGLAVEVDGAGHKLESRKKRDARRDAWTSRQGIRTLRFPASAIRNNLKRVLAQIQQECASRSPSTG